MSEARSRTAQLIALSAFALIGFFIYSRQQPGGIAQTKNPAIAPAQTPASEVIRRPGSAASAPIAPRPTTIPASPLNYFARTDEAIARASNTIRQSPQSTEAYDALASAFLQKFRESADAGYLSRAESACLKARELSPDDPSAISLLPCIYNAQHRFFEAIPLARKAIAADPNMDFNYGTLGDALLEIGDYDGALAATNQMVRLHPGSWSYARIARLRELYGDVNGAIKTMRMSVQASLGAEPEQRAWCWTQMGNLYFNQGRLEEAEAEYAEALEAFPPYSFGLTSLARLRAAQGKTDEAISLYRRALDIAPRQETVVLLGDLLLSLHREKEAADLFELMDAIEKIMRANHVLPGYVLVLFWADHDVKLDEALAQAEESAAERSDIKTMDALAWARYKNGKYAEALEVINKALRLKTPDASLYFHRGMIQLKLGNAPEAVAALKRAMEINPYFDVRHAPEARAAIQTLEAKQ